MTIKLSPIGTYSTGIFDESGAEIPAYDPVTKRLFVVNAQSASVDVLNLSDPTNPVKIGVIEGAAFGGVANSVAISNGIVAIALEANTKTDHGNVIFFNTNSDFSAAVTPIKTVQVGALPDMLTFTKDGTKVLVANEGEPNDDYSVDPEGSVSIIDISNGLANATVVTANFNAFDAQKEALIAQGVRIFGPNATVSQDLEPEYITISADSQTAYIALQENNAIAIVDIATATVEAIKPLGFKDYSFNSGKLQTYEINNLPAIGTTIGNQEILLGGFSGLYFEGKTDDGQLKFITHTDRGPNGEPTGSLRPFLLPNFSPEIVRFELNQTTGEITITERISIKQANGTPITGLPNINITDATGNTPYNDEIPVDLNNNQITSLDPFGADLEAIVIAQDGTFWMVDEYRPAIYHFNTDGTLIDRFVPQGTGVAAGGNAGDFGIETLPVVIAQRRQNRGFEAVALDAENNKLYAFVQSPIRNPDTLSNGTLNGLNNIRIVEFDLTTKTTTAEYLYRMDNPNLGTPDNTRADKIGDAVYIGNGEFLVVERDDDAIDSDPSGNLEKKVYRFSLEGATNITNQSAPIDLGGGVLKTVDEMTPEELTSQGINLINKNLYVDLAQAGYNTVEKVEGLAYLGNNTIAVINDNDFRVAGITLNGDGTFTVNDDYTPEPVVLGILQVQPNELDVSDRDNVINLRNWPIFGMYQPDAIASYQVNGQTYIITANEGDTRDYETFSEESRVKDLLLDPVAFPNAAELQRDDQLGRLTVTTTLGDTDGDGDFDQLYSFGARSFSIWDQNLNLVFDSGNQLEAIIAQQIADGLLPASAFNTNHTSNNSFDTRSDDKGIEPEAVAVGVINGQTYAFIGLERVGGVFVYNVSNPQNPEYVQYINNRNFVDEQGNVIPTTITDGNGNTITNPLTGDLGAEGLIFVSAEDSPNGKPLIMVANEVSGTTSIFEVEIPQPQPFTLQLFHFADQEAGIAALDDAPRFSAVLNALRAEDIDGDGVAGFANTLTLSSGDAYIPGLFFNASATAFGGVGRADILIQNELGVQAIAFGNHEFDQGTAIVKDLIAGDGQNFPGTNFPYLSSNLDFSTDTNLAGLVVPNAQAPQPNSIAASTVIEINGEKIGVVGATTPTLNTISNPGNVTVLPQSFGGIPTAAQLDALAAEIQADVNALLTANPDVDKVILLAHMQQISIEQALATRLSNVDIIVAGGSNTRLFDESDHPRPGDSVQGQYPIFSTDADGNPIAIVNTDGNYKYVGRLVLDFDQNGLIIPTSYDAEVSGAYATDAQGVTDLNAGNLVDPEIQNIVDNVREVIIGQESNIFGISNVFLNGTRNNVRTEETNLGNLTADANLAIAQETDPTVVISLKNGGGIRNNIGRVVVPTGSTGEVESLPTEAVLDAEGNIVKPAGGISQNDIANALSFNNGLSLITVTAGELLAILEHAVSASGEGATPGQFPQVSGFEFSFDLTKPAGDRLQSLAIKDNQGNILDVVVQNGELQGDASRTFRMVTLGFLAGGGDGYPFPQGESANRIDLAQAADAVRTGNATFAPDGTEQDAFAEYLFTNFLNTPFNQADTTASQDTRIQNLAVRNDTVIPFVPPSVSPLVFGGLNDNVFDAADPADGFDGNNQLLFAGGGNDVIDASAATVGNNRIFAGSGDDELYAGKGDRLFAAEGNDTIYLNEGQGGNRVYGGAGNDEFFLGTGAPQSGSPGDRLFGGSGDDSFFVGTGGNNIITGGEGADEFWIATAGQIPANGNRITDFNPGEDILGIGGFDNINNIDHLNIVSNNGLTIISVKDTNDILVTLNGEFTLGEANFVFQTDLI